jgi:hypothetical protein
MNLYLVSHESKTLIWSTYVRAPDHVDAMNKATGAHAVKSGGTITITHLTEYLES